MLGYLKDAGKDIVKNKLLGSGNQEAGDQVDAQDGGGNSFMSSLAGGLKKNFLGGGGDNEAQHQEGGDEGQNKLISGIAKFVKENLSSSGGGKVGEDAADEGEAAAEDEAAAGGGGRFDMAKFGLNSNMLSSVGGMVLKGFMSSKKGQKQKAIADEEGTSFVDKMIARCSDKMVGKVTINVVKGLASDDEGNIDDIKKNGVTKGAAASIAKNVAAGVKGRYKADKKDDENEDDDDDDGVHNDLVRKITGSIVKGLQRSNPDAPATDVDDQTIADITDKAMEYIFTQFT